MRTRLILLASLAVSTRIIAQEEPAAPLAPAVPSAEAVATPSAVETMPDAAPAAPPAVTPAPVVPDAAPAIAVATKNKDTLSVDFPDEEIRTILRNVADLFELNLVIPDTLQGRTSLKLREVTWRQIFQVILSPIGYTFVEDGNIIKIVSQDSLLAEPVSTEIFIINYAKAADILTTVSTLVDPAVGGKIIVDQRSNALVVTERPSRLGRIRPIIEKLDHATEQVMIESKFIEITSGNERELGLDWTVAGGSKGGTYKSYETSNAAPSPGVTITGTPIAAGNPSALTTSFLTGADYTALLQAAESNNTARVVNNPTLVTLNNVQAEINIGEEYPIPSYTYNAERGAFEVSGFEYKPIGVLLKVTPQINSQGFIKLTLEPEISQRGLPVNFGGASGADIPIINTRKTKTQVSLQDGHTLGIGGLIKDDEAHGTNQLPILGSIPGIGRLFQNKTKEKNRTNLLIFITAKVINSKTAQPEEIYDPRVLREAQLKRSDVSGYREAGDPFLPEAPPAQAATELKK
ncbi:MAG: type and secretion system protein [Rariglobus sp.]|jgi:type IV pilus assembly protein PilQ|nr:type and secretion system protein [Rariglobus sp.]